MTPLRVGLIGLGNVGTGVARLLRDHADRIERRAGRPVVLTRVAVRDVQRQRDVTIDPQRVTTDPLSVANATDVDVVVELMGGLCPARKVVHTALEAGKDVVTANKALLCEHGPELFAAAREHGRCIAFEASVAGGIPIIAVLNQSMTGNQITTIQAIINGTSNFILTEMFRTGGSYDDTVREAQQRGYAEADPAMDVNGTDAAQKLAILTQLAYGTRLLPGQFPVQGIDTIEPTDLVYADELGYAVKLLATARLASGKLEMHVQPTLIRHGRPLAQVDGAHNMIALTGDAVGPTWYSGPGAGQMPTASSVMADIIDVAVGRAQITFKGLNLGGEQSVWPLQPAAECYRRYYLRFNVDDRPHVMADITDILGRQSISLASVIQHEAPEPEGENGATAAVVPLVIMTHRTTEGQLQQALAELGRLGSVRTPSICMPVSD
jgi:homoserine dehydrogenase